MIYTQEVENMCPVAQGVHHGAAPVPTEGKWVQNKKVEDISGFTHGVGWCAPQQGACKLGAEAAEGLALLEKQLTAVGYHIDYSRGDYNN